MALAINIIDIMHACGSSNKMVTVKEDQNKAVLVVNIVAKDVMCAVNY